MNERPCIVSGEGDIVANFDAAAMYLDIARKAHEAGDVHQSRAACVMVGVALAINDSSPRFHLSHIDKAKG